jgi:hypothetical protein
MLCPGAASACGRYCRDRGKITPMRPYVSADVASCITDRSGTGKDSAAPLTGRSRTTRGLHQFGWGQDGVRVRSGRCGAGGPGRAAGRGLRGQWLDWRGRASRSSSDIQAMTGPVLTQGLKAARRKRLIEMLGGKCARCGSAESLEFDHIDPSTKKFTISSVESLGCPSRGSRQVPVALQALSCGQGRRGPTRASARHLLRLLVLELPV